MKIHARLNRIQPLKNSAKNSRRLYTLFFSIRNLIIIAVIFAYSCSKPNKAIINARIGNAAKSMVYLIEPGTKEDKIIDSTIIKKNGKFKFSLPLEISGYYQLNFKDGKSLTIILSPGEKLNLTSDFNNFYRLKKIEGSLNSVRLNFLQDTLRSTVSILEKIRNDYSSIAGSGKDTSQLNNLSIKYNKIIESYRRFSIGFILEDLKSLTNIAALYQEYSPGVLVFSKARDMQYYKLVSDTLGKYYPKVKQVKVLLENYKTFYDSYLTKKMIQMAKPADNHMPDLKLPDKIGAYKSLSSFRGKIVLLSFWSVINSGCIRDNEDMQKIYKKFHKKGFEIYQVSIDNSIDAWRKELSSEKIPWISVCDTAFFNSATRGLYNVNSLPLNYLINSDQTKVLDKNLSYSNLDQKLNELLK